MTSEVVLEPGGVAGDEACGAGHAVGPAVAGLGERDGVEAFAVDDHEGVFGVGVDRDVVSGTRFAVGLQGTRVLGRAEQAGSVKRVGDGTGAVIAF